VAREVLLDGIEALAEHAQAVTIVGAQAVYLRSANVDLTVPSFTSDADLSIDPERLRSSPLVEEAMTAAGFVRHASEPGQWYTSRQVGSAVADIAVDLLVAQGVAGRPGRRGADISPHDRRAARQVDGLEAALLDADVLDVASLAPIGDGAHRVLPARVAGPAALLVAKAYKIDQRINEAGPRRLDNKDAGDIVRLMMATDPSAVAKRFERLFEDTRTANVTVEGIRKLRSLFGGAQTSGTVLAMEAMAGDPIEDQIPNIAAAYMDVLPDEAND
jgi:hypothetical protein